MGSIDREVKGRSFSRHWGLFVLAAKKTVLKIFLRPQKEATVTGDDSGFVVERIVDTLSEEDAMKT